MSIFNNDLSTVDRINKHTYLINKYKWYELRHTKSTLMKGTLKNNDLLKNINHYLTRLCLIHNKMVVKQDYHFDYQHRFNGNRVLTKIRDYAYQLLQINGFNIMNMGTMTLLSYRPNTATTKSKTKQNHFSTTFDSRFSTCIFYIKKYKDIVEGKIRYMDGNNHKKYIELRENNVLCFNGSLKNTLKYINGHGLMTAVIIRFVSK